MAHKLIKSSEVFHKDLDLGINLDVYPVINNACEVVLINAETGHNQEFYDITSTFTYIILEGEGTFVLNDEEVKVFKGDFISIEPNTRLYYKGAMRLVLITTPPWQAENEVETKSKVW